MEAGPAKRAPFELGTAGAVLRAELGRTHLPVLLHPEFWSRRRIALPGREPIELPSTSRSSLEGAGFDVIEQQQPSLLLDHQALVANVRGAALPTG